MQTGFECYNQNGILQITAEYQNFAYIGKVQPTPTYTLDWPNAGWVYTLSTNVLRPIVAVNSEWPIALNTLSTSNGVTSYSFIIPAAFNPGAVTFYIFGLIPPPPSNFGIEIYTLSGLLAFSSSAKVMKVIGQISGPSYADLYQNAKLINSIVQKKAVVFADVSGEYSVNVTAPGGIQKDVEWYRYAPCLVTAVDGLYWYEREVGYLYFQTSGSVIPTFYQSLPYSWTLIDVTGY